MAKLLIVEDEKNLGILYDDEFQKEGYEVTLANNGFEALQKMKDNNPDLVILDMCLPDKDGISVLKKMIEIDKFLPIIINSAYYNYKDDFNCRAAKAFLIKSGDLSQLKSKVAEFIINRTQSNHIQTFKQ